MPIGWIRAYQTEIDQFGYIDYGDIRRNSRAEFRRDFQTILRDAPNQGATELAEIKWGQEIELPNGIESSEWTTVVFDGTNGFVKSEHLVEIAYINRRSTKKGFESTITYQKSQSDGSKKDVHVKLLWGDCVQILERNGDTCRARARGFIGTVNTSHLTEEALMEVYFIDVGQGDGVLVRTPDHRHILIDGGLERGKQQTGKNAADFVDWKFFFDYGDFTIRLNSMTASHSDNDHYGGLHDLVRLTDEAKRELDCTDVSIDTLHHPGLSRWESRKNAVPAHKDGLGPQEPNADGDPYFTRLLDDRADAEQAVINNAEHELSGPWKSFFRDVLKNKESTEIRRVGVTQEQLDANQLPLLWDDTENYSVRILSPVFENVNGALALPDLGNKGQNTNGHSVCYRIDYGNARILLTGDLNKKSMDWIMRSYDDLMGAWACDVAKACHHGSHDISYRFLQRMNPAATIISSGDAEGHAHPRPEIVGASAVTGRVEIDSEEDVLKTPLIYMNEIEHSVTLGAIDRIDIEGLPQPDDATVAAFMPGRFVDELNNAALLSKEEEKKIDALPQSEQSELRNELRKINREIFRRVEEKRLSGEFKATASMTVANGPLSPTYEKKSLWRARLVEKNHYGLVNVRTDGDVIMCATLDETDDDWIVHDFTARSVMG